jgi:hypothetical protein
MADPQSVAPILGSMASAVIASLRNPSQAGPVDRAMGATASLGLCLAVLRVVGNAYKTSRHLENGDPYEASGNNTHKRGGLTGSVGHFLYAYMRKFLRRVLEDEDVDIMDDDFNPSSHITHAGSCHCGSVDFEVVAPRCLQVRDGVGKIQYRHTKVKTSNFKVFKGHECLKTYYVVSDRNHDKGAHAFCQHCGVHILYAPWKNSPNLFINVNCLPEGIRKVRVAHEVDSDILDVVPTDTQWDALSTVSEVSFQRTESLAPGNSYDPWGSRFSDRIDENSVTHSVSDFFYQKKSEFALSPSLTAATESQLSSDTSLSTLRLPGSDDSTIIQHDGESTVRSFNSVRSQQQKHKAISLKPLNIRQDISPADQQVSTPEMRDHMKKFMKKHLSPPKKSGIKITKMEENDASAHARQ